MGSVNIPYEDEITKPTECPICGSARDLIHVTHSDGVTCHIQCGLFEGEPYSGCDWKSRPFRRRKSCNISSSEPWGDYNHIHMENNVDVAKRMGLKYCMPGKDSFTDVNGKVHITGRRYHLRCPYCGDGADHCACNCPEKWVEGGGDV